MSLLLKDCDTAVPLLLALALKTTMVLALAWVLTLALRWRSAALRHAVWTVGVLSSLLLPILVLLMPTWGSPYFASVVGHWSAPRSIMTVLAPSTMSAMSVDAVANTTALSNWRFLVLLAWAAGVGLLALRLGVGLARLGSRSASCKALVGDDWSRHVAELSRRLKLTRPVSFLLAEASGPMPLTWGIIRPRILLPADAKDWTEERKRVVISHEMVHIRRRDWLWQICAEVLRALYWFHPLVWVAAAKLRQESERACDDGVLSTGIAGLDYARHLLDLARTFGNARPGWAAALAVARPSSLERRLVAMLNPSIDRRGLTHAARLTIAAATILLLLPLAALRLPAQNLSGAFTGSVSDASGTGVRNATVIMTIPKGYMFAGKEYASNETQMTTTDDDGKFTFKSLPAGEYELRILKRGFEEYRAPQVMLEPGRESSLNVTLKIGSVMEEVDVVPEGTVKPLPESQNAGKPVRLRLGGDVQAAKLITKVQPLYPVTAKTAGIQGTVILHAVIGLDGRPLSLRVMNKDVDPDLARASVEAVNQWRYQPTLLNGEPIEVDTTIKVNFTLAP
jgi:TonB family protein